jgi:hypothetical protein
VDEIEDKKPKEVKHPRQCIADFCLYHCEKKEMRNSRRSVSECLLASCPLWPYRTGKLKWEKDEKDLSKTKRERRIDKLRKARRKAENAETVLRSAQDNLKEKQERFDEAKAYVKQLETAFYVTEDPDGIWR